MTKGTALGVILGTASYMSPEQARGKPVDKRTDIWAFGCCLYEALTGKLAFGGETATDSLSRILQLEPDWEALPSTLSPTVRRLLSRCLQKDSRERLHDIADARLELKEPRTDGGVTTQGHAESTKRLVAGVLIASIITGLVVAALMRRDDSSSNPTVPFFDPSTPH